ncbi:MAG: FAD-dependent oxidoreductase [Deltaproteobacteria bacterium]|nr:FAD-dependent oxidoreductase [Deltaproteobacteria bacterium]
MEETDCVVLGAGVSGLTAAWELSQRGQSVQVLEARERVGGRTWSGVLEGAEVDWGGEWIGHGQPRVYALVEALGLHTFPTWDRGEKVLELRGRTSTYRGTIPWMAPWKLLQVQAGIWYLDALARRLSPEEPWAHARAVGWDATTLDAARRLFLWSADARGVMDAAMRTIFGAEAGELSLLHALAYIRSAGSLQNLIATEGGFQHDRLRGGAQALALALAAKLGEARVHLGRPVTEVRHDGSSVTVRDAIEGVWRARRAVCAVPLPLAARIAFEPQLPPLRTQLTERAYQGAAVKCFARYERAFWRERGLSGEAASADGFVSVTFDQCGEDGATPCLLAFVGGRSARTWHQRDPAERKAAVLDRLAAYFGPEARSPTAWGEADWCAERWSGGGPIALFPTGTLSTHGPALREPCGRIHWAGTETARACMGFIEGAVEAGQRAAEEILQAG